MGGYLASTSDIDGENNDKNKYIFNIFKMSAILWRSLLWVLAFADLGVIDYRHNNVESSGNAVLNFVYNTTALAFYHRSPSTLNDARYSNKLAKIYNLHAAQYTCSLIE